MDQAITVVHVDDVAAERMQSSDGWAISEFRLPVSGADGSATTLFHAIFRAGSTHSRHVHTNCDEFVAYVEGEGVVGGGDGRERIASGYRRRVPQGSEHFFKNEGTTGEALVVGFYVGAGSVEGSGYEHRGTVGPEDVEPPFPGIDDGVLVTVDDTPLADLSGVAPWSQAEVRMSVGSHTGTPNALLDASLRGGAGITPHRMRHCEQLYFVAGGTGVVESGTTSTEVRAGHVVFVPKDAEFAVRSADGAQPLWFLGVLTGAGSLAEAGCEAL
jgi:mannose-6-phosphate isomerase-like protein (cupin superfamily)